MDSAPRSPPHVSTIPHFHSRRFRGEQVLRQSKGHALDTVRALAPLTGKRPDEMSQPMAVESADTRSLALDGREPMAPTAVP
jgi:hypothetical protein